MMQLRRPCCSRSSTATSSFATADDITCTLGTALLSVGLVLQFVSLPVYFLGFHLHVKNIDQTSDRYQQNHLLAKVMMISLVGSPHSIPAAFFFFF